MSKLLFLAAFLLSACGPTRRHPTARQADFCQEACGPYYRFTVVGGQAWCQCETGQDVKILKGKCSNE